MMVVVDVGIFVNMTSSSSGSTVVNYFSFKHLHVSVLIGFPAGEWKQRSRKVVQISFALVELVSLLLLMVVTRISLRLLLLWWRRRN